MNGLMKQTIDVDDLYEVFPKEMVDHLVEQLRQFATEAKEILDALIDEYGLERMKSELEEMLENATEDKGDLDFIEDDESSDWLIIGNRLEINLVENVVDGFIFKEWKPP